MFQRLSTDTVNWIIIIGVILFVVEIAFFHGGMLIPAMFFGVLVYFGWKKYHRLWGKILFWIGTISLLFAVLNLMAVRFLLVVSILLFLWDYLKKRNETMYIQPKPIHDETSQSSLIKLTPIFKHQLFKDQETPDEAYRWTDINIHSAFGDQVIDLSQTFLPDDTAIISIRHLVGNIEVYVPYEVEVSIHHSSVFGRVHIFDQHHIRLVNQTLSYETEGYQTGNLRVKIITSIFSGDIEVKRI
ncbi:hypothetical protein FHP05_06530 [Cerasibacillus terrae]|uniref:Cell wall-active antibiotics response LiaF-like C-terminal domain-containing protein n=1 Tax=Cerasibacillus terrae TaxID=2498845 RepID=A0A5C8NX29_9BACI|nr:cell wall-active antibiotics response protein LiaF [Cerasibacillus terrae]TXL65772.1 hypothetical protein FHP05_06530 [Cerasibacillus terrae]